MGTERSGGRSLAARGMISTCLTLNSPPVRLIGAELSPAHFQLSRPSLTPEIKVPSQNRIICIERGRQDIPPTSSGGFSAKKKRRIWAVLGAVGVSAICGRRAELDIGMWIKDASLTRRAGRRLRQWRLLWPIRWDLGMNGVPPHFPFGTRSSVHALKSNELTSNRWKWRNRNKLTSPDFFKNLKNF